ncbi:MAG: NAD(P)/FAD-dependent oxidoreductase [Culicoidibacterales bacterium]
MQHYDVLVVGGGPAGMFAAWQASLRYPRVAILEKNAVLGKKMLITGGGRCNITNIHQDDNLIAGIVGNGRFLHSVFSQFNNNDLIRFYEQNGLMLKEENKGRMFPITDKAQSVVDTLSRVLKKSGVTIHFNCDVQTISPAEPLQVKTSIGQFSCDKLIITTGGKSVPQTGSTGVGYQLAAKFGHTITELFPTEVPLTSDEAFIRKKVLQGLSLYDIHFSVLNHKGKPLVTQRYDLLFTHFGVSGPAALRASQFVVKQLKKQQPVTVVLDVLPDQNVTEVQTWLKTQDGNKAIKNAWKSLVSERYLLFLLEQAGLAESTPLKQLTPKQIETVAQLLKGFHFSVNGTQSLEKSFVTGGGIKLKEIDPKTMQSKFDPRLAFAGEILDIHAYTGGYNLTVAQCTGFVAGRHI